ncbi:tubulin binding cofactor A [Dendryphion nanum]|uniref:Tubulin-specific chaperone A n=1 Tax=Dendryphion nanum TaxID=256645 RepID=A0A9P9IFS8_9PLEO|nr:tubulin binding cofactor A [Dendryphion nanum]
MAPPSKLAIATSSVLRLVKEEASYHKEQEQQEARIKKLETNTEDENAEYQLKQERQALQETKNIFPSLQTKITQAVERLEEQLEAGGDAPIQEVAKAQEAITASKKSLGVAA